MIAFASRFRPPPAITGLLLAVLVLILLGDQASAAKRMALVIGNDDYDQVADLKKAGNDASAIARALEDIGYEVLIARDVPRREMNRQLQLFASQLEPGDEALFYYAGHGVEISGRNYLLPTDIPGASAGQEDFVTSEAIPVDEVLDRIRSRGTRVAILILDACRDNPFPKKGTRSLGGSRGLTRSLAPEGTFIMYSAGVGQTALDRLSNNDPNPNSVFTRSLIPLLQTPGMSLTRTAREVRRDVQKLAATVSHEQRPAYYDEVTGDFFFAGAGRPQTKPESQASKPAATPPVTDPAAQAWTTVKDTQSEAILETFIESFPDSLYAKFAKARLDELGDKRTASLTPRETPQGQTEAMPSSEQPTARAADEQGWLGVTIQGLTNEIAKTLGLDEPTGALVTSVTPESPAERAGLRSGDLIVEFDGNIIKTMRDLPKLLAATSPGGSQILVYQRNGKKEIATVSLERLADKPGYKAMQLANDASAAYSDGDYSRSMKVATQAAELGEPLAMYTLARIHHFGKGVKKDIAEANKWYRKAAELGDISSMFQLGYHYSSGTGVKQDDKEAFKWLNSAADKNHLRAIALVGYAYEYGKGVKKDAGKAFEYFNRAANLGDVQGKFSLAWAYNNGLGTSRDGARSADLFLQVLESGENTDFYRKTVIDFSGRLTKATIRGLQQKLNGAGHYQGSIDGQFGPATQRAIDKLTSTSG